MCTLRQITRKIFLPRRAFLSVNPVKAQVLRNSLIFSSLDDEGITELGGLAIELGEMFDEVAVFGNKTYPTSTQAAAETRVLGIGREDLQSFITRRPEVALRIINVPGERLMDAQSRLRNIAGERVNALPGHY